MQRNPQPTGKRKEQLEEPLLENKYQLGSQVCEVCFLVSCFLKNKVNIHQDPRQQGPCNPSLLGQTDTGLGLLKTSHVQRGKRLGLLGGSVG